MPIITDSFQDLFADLHRLVHAMDFTRPDASGGVGYGYALLESTAQAIEAQCADEKDPDDVPWPDLSADYANWKMKEVGPAPIGVLYDLMLRPDEIRGTQRVTDTTAEMTYGVTPEAKQEAAWFQEGYAREGALGEISEVRPPRPFYGIPVSRENQAVAPLDGHFQGFDATQP